MNQLALDLLQPLRPTLDNFVPGRNAEALAALRAAAAGQGPQFLYLWGADGAGRTHLLRALGGDDARPAAVPVYEPGHRLYAIDDADRLDTDGQAALFALYNEVRARPDARLVASGSAPPPRLQLREDLRTRLGWGPVYQLHALSDAEKAQALVAHAASRGIVLSAEVRAYMLGHLPRDMRTLVAVLDALDAYALARQRAITLPLLREWLAQAAA